MKVENFNSPICFMFKFNREVIGLTKYQPIKGNIPIRVLNAVLYAHNASSCFERPILPRGTQFFPKICFSSLLEISTLTIGMVRDSYLMIDTIFVQKRFKLLITKMGSSITYCSSRSVKSCESFSRFLHQPRRQ